MERTVDKSNVTIVIEAQIPPQLDKERLMSGIKALICDLAVKARIRAYDTDAIAIAKAILPKFKLHLHHYSELSQLPIDSDDTEKIFSEEFLYAAEYVGQNLCNDLELHADSIARQIFEMSVEARIKSMFNDEITKFLDYLGEQNRVEV